MSDDQGGGAPKRRYDGKVVIVTGGGQGIGRATALRVAAEGASVGVVDIDQAGGERTRDEIAAAGGRGLCVVSDLRQFDAAERAVTEVAERLGPIDVLVNNVGGTILIKPFIDYSPDEVVAEMERSLWPTVWTCRAVLPAMVERGSGAIVNVGSTSVRGPYRIPYATAKGGVQGLTTSLASEVARHGVRVNCVAPGATAVDDRIRPRGFEGSEEAVEWFGELTSFFQHQILMGRWAEPAEQASAIAFLGSDDAAFITGQTLVVAGGAHL